jgi:hypothetical protein
MDLERLARLGVLLDLAAEEAGRLDGPGLATVREALATAKEDLDRALAGLVIVPADGGDESEAPW